jgi:hypothetical protein
VAFSGPRRPPPSLPDGRGGTYSFTGKRGILHSP